MGKLIIVIMGPGKKHFAEMCLESVKDADKILYWTSHDSRIELFGSLKFCEENKDKIEIEKNGWEKTDPATNGKCRQRYLEYLKENYPDDWAICLDEDEILEEGGIEKIKKFITEREPGIYNVKMRHFIGSLGFEDATLPIHVVPARLFKISEAIKYPEHSHPVLEGELKGACLDTTIWHLGHLPLSYMDYILQRYKQHAKDSIIHTPEFLKNWKLSHLFGQYPTKQINPLELPQQICDRYEIDKDEFYFANRGLEVKHFIDAIHWKNYFKCKNAWEFGCGRGPRVFAMNQIGIKTNGIELSKFAVDNQIQIPGYVLSVIQGDITNTENYSLEKRDLVVVYDLLEHLKYEDLNKVLNKINETTNKYVLFSIPFEGDPNLEADPTHIIKESKEWWVKKLSQYFTIKDAPTDWLFHEQLLIGEKK